jgi:CRISPR-associated protein Cst2
MNKKALTITYVVKAFPLNYDEGYGNVSVVKKVHRGSGDTYLFTSRQALRYSLVNWLVDHGFWQFASLTSAEGVIQYDPSQLEREFPPEADLFGYMITGGKGKPAFTRSAVARLTHLISLEPWYGDQELLTNKNFADRIGENPDMANVETGYSYYKYTLSVDLDKVGEDKNFNHSLTLEEKIKRVCDLIEATKFLYRDIRGRREDLKPLFVIGGVYHIKSLFFHNAININFKGSKPVINWEAINQVLEVKYSFNGEEIKVKDLTIIGIQKGDFLNDLNIDKSSFEALDEIKQKVKEAYEEGR